MFKFQLKFNQVFGFLFLSSFFFWKDIHWSWFYLSYFLFAGLGVGLGFHRILGHGLIVKGPLRWFSVWVGSLAHLGSPKGAAMWHLNHHRNADTEFDQVKRYRQALLPTVKKLNVKRSDLKKVFEDLDNDMFFKMLDSYYYLVFFFSYFILVLLLGIKTTFLYVLAPASLSLFIHSLSTIYLHSLGYRNFETTDRSKNSLLLWPILFGENWHNNHHFNSYSPNQSSRWWEIDVIYLIAKPFTRSGYRW